MVFESIVTDLLNKYIGEYVENLDASQLRIGIWGGDVVLHNLVLKQSALDELDLPIRTIYGVLGKLVLKIPWKNLYNDKVEAYVEGLYLLAVPNQDVKYNPVKEEKWLQEAKQTQLRKVEDAKKREAEKDMVKPDDSFVEKLATQIIKNVEVKIGDIHIRYEDRTSNIGRPFAMGVTLHNLVVQTTDSQWKKTLTTEATNFFFKELTMEGLSVYLNCNCVQFTEKTPEELLHLFKEGIISRDNTPKGYDYMLGPINSSARLKINPKPELDGSDYTIPKMELMVELETLSIGIGKNQHHDVMLMIESFEWMMRAGPYRKYRPFVSGYRGNYKAWWQFAYKCILEEEVRRRRRNWDWRVMSAHRDKCKTYAELYRMKLQSKKLSYDSAERIRDLEQQLDVFNIVLIRQRIEVQVAKDTEELKRQQLERKSWFSSWWGSGATSSMNLEPSSAEDLAKKFEAAMTPEEKAKLFRAIDYNENAVPAIYPTEYVENRFSFKMNSLDIRLTNDELTSKTVLHSSLQQVNAQVEQRNGGQALKVNVKIKKFTVEGAQQEGMIPMIVSSKLNKDAHTMLLDVLFEIQPLDELCDQRLHIEARPLRIIYDACTLNNVLDLFRPPDAPTLQSKIQAGLSTPALKEMSVLGMQYAVEKQSRLDISFDFMSSHIIIPQSGLYRGEENAIIANLGRMTVKTEQKDSDSMSIRHMHLHGKTEADILSEMMARSYTRFVLKLEDIQVLLAYAGEDWKKILLHVDQSPLHLVRPFSFTMTVDKCAVLDDPRLPKMRVTAELGDINLELPEDRLLCCINLPATIPFNVAESVPLSHTGYSDNVSRSSQQSLFSDKLTGKSNLGVARSKNVPIPKLERDHPALVQATDIHANFTLNHLVISVYVPKEIPQQTESEEFKEAESEENPVPAGGEPWDANLTKLLTFRLLNFRMEYIKCTFDMKMNMTLGLIDLTQQYDNYDIEIIGTPRMNPGDYYLFSAKFVQVDKRSPEFRTIHRSTLKRIEIDFASLSVIAHLEALLNLIPFVNRLQAGLDNALSAPSSKTSTQKPATHRKLTTITEDSEAHHETLSALKAKRAVKRKKQKPSSIVLMKIECKIKCVGVQFVTSKKAIAQVSVCGAFITLAFKKGSTEVALRLSDVCVLDMSPRSRFKKVLSYVDEDVFSANVAMYDLDNKADANDVNMVVKVRMGCMHLVFINHFVSCLTGFLNNFQSAQAAIFEASAAAATAAKENAKDVYAKASKMSLDIELKAPIVIIPVNSFSFDGFLVDLGRLTINNTFETRNINSQAVATLDSISLILHNMKISRVRLQDIHSVITECGILKPISFKLTVVRNLSFLWFKEAPELDISAELQSINLDLSQGDYSMAMKVLSENLGDVEESESAPLVLSKLTEQPSSYGTEATVKTEDRSPKPNTTVGTPTTKDQVYVFMKFSFSMQSLVIALYTRDKTAVDPQCINDKQVENGLACFTLNGLSVHGLTKTDNSLHTSLSLVDCLLDDLRYSQTSKIKRFMESKKIQPEMENIPSNLSYDEGNIRMVTLTVNMNNESLTVDMLVNAFTLIISIEFLMNVKDFFVKGLSESAEGGKKDTPSSHSVAISHSAASRATNVIGTAAKTTPKKKTKVHVRLEQPDIVMVESMDLESTHALVLNVEVEFKVSLIEDVMTVNGSLKDFQLYVSTSFPDHTDESKSRVISPATLDINGSNRESGLKMDAVCTAIHIALTPGTLELLNRCYVTSQGTPDSEDEKLIENDYSNIWRRRSFTDPEYWFLKTEKGLEVSEVSNLESKATIVAKAVSELVMVAFPKITLTLEAGDGAKTLPMILVETNFTGKLKDFSSQMSVESSLTLQVSYYNSRLALWEPLIEPVETLINDQVFHNPWELKIEVAFTEATNTGMDESQISSLEDDIEAIALPPRMKVSLSASANLELTITKTALEVLNTLGEAFQSAMNSHLAACTGLCLAPYQVRNHTGITVHLDLESSAFQLANHDFSNPIEVVVLESGATIALELQERNEVLSRSSLIASPSKLRIERFLAVKPEKQDSSLNLPVVRADKRYFTLSQKGDTTNSQWGLISDVQVENGGFIVTLRSIIQVHNHFSVPVNVYFMTERGNELESVGVVEPKGKINLPLPAVYTPTSELFFSVDGYSVSVSPFKWRDLQNSLVISKLLQCEPKRSEETEPFFLTVVGEMEQVLFENTTRHTMPSTCYNVHLRPPVILKNYLPWQITCCLQGVPVQKTLEAGQHLEIPTVEPGSSTIVLTIPDYLEKKWSCKSAVRANPPELSVWSFESFDSMETVTLNLGMHTITDNGTMVMALYSPFWMLNKTGLNLSYKHSDEGGSIFFHPADFVGPILLPYHSKDFLAKKKAALKVEDEEWSPNFPLDVAGSSGQVSCKYKGVLYQFGVYIELNSNSLTKRVLITPYYVILNSAPFAIECREDDQSRDSWLKVESHDCCPLWPKSAASEKNLRVRVAGTREMSAPFSYNTVYTVLLRLQNKYGGLSLDVRMTEGGIYLSFMPYEPGLAPALFINHTKCDLKIWEADMTKVETVGPQECILFAWENPTGVRSVRWSCNDSREVTDNLRKDGLGKITTSDNSKIFWVSFLDGTQRIVLLTTDDSVARDALSAGDVETATMSVTISIHGLGLSLVNNITKHELLYLGIASSGAIWETRKQNKSHFKHISAADNRLMEEVWEEYQQALQVEGTSNPHRRISKYLVNFEDMTVSIPNNRLLRRSFQTGLWINYRVSAHQVQIHLKINRIQIDSQMPDCIFPVVLAPVPPPHSVAADKALKPFLEMSVVKRLTEHSPVQQYKYCKVLIQEFHIKVDISFLSAIAAFFEAEAISEEDEVKHFNADLEVVKSPLKCHATLQSTAEQKNFYDLLHFSPLKIHISFSLGEEAGSSQNLPHILSVFMQSVGVTLTEMHDVVFKLAYLEREYVFLTQAQLISEAKMHYTGQLLKQFYVLVFGLDVIGNPFGLVVGLTKGVEDFFYEPFQGAIQGPGEFARGLVLGVRSLFGHTVGGAAGAASRITSTLGKGLAVLTFDDEYIRKRRENQNKRPANLHTGLAQSGKGLLMGVVDGVTGVVTKPVSGYKEGSWGGMFKGVGKGMAGLITRPTAGIVDFASGSFNAVKRATEMTDEVTRLRPPRYFQPDGVLRPYAKHEAEGNKILLELEKGRYSTTDVYIHHIVMAHSGGKEIVLITDKRIAYLKSNDIFGGWQVDWAYTWTELAEPPSAEPEGILLVSNDQKKKKRLLGSSSNKRLLLIPDSEQRQRMISKMEDLFRKNNL